LVILVAIRLNYVLSVNYDPKLILQHGLQAPAHEHEEVELILEGYKDDLQDLHLRISGLSVQVRGQLFLHSLLHRRKKLEGGELALLEAGCDVGPQGKVGP
jgi:hypothetical protein